jgi:cytosine/adenosine deaminase-related metal-dependent hydrolase
MRCASASGARRPRQDGEGFPVALLVQVTPPRAFRELGLAAETGILEPGKPADIVAVAGDSLMNIRQTEKVFFVMKQGIVYRNDR